MKNILAALFLTISTLSIAQNMSVGSFHLVQNDLTANTHGTMVHDQNGNLCALIKVETTHDGFTFDVGSLGVSEVRRVGGEVWVYVPFGVRRMTLSHPQFGVIRDYQFPCAIEKGRTYIMTLIAGTVRTIVEQATSKQFLWIELNPSDAILEINGKVKATDNGVYQELMPFGTYQYKAYCQNYHDLMGQVTISDPDNTHSLELSLRPNFGFLSINATRQPDIKGAFVYIDERYVGEIPLSNLQIASGSHKIRIIKEMYEAYNGTFTIADEEHKSISQHLTPDFADVTLQAGDNAAIYINGDFKGNGQWSGRLSCGSYIFETRKPGHIAYKMPYDITVSDNSKRIFLQGPTPIYGSLVISSTPSKSRICIDGQYIGETPKYISRQVIGEYEVTLEAKGYEKQTKTVSVTEGNESSLVFTLQKIEAQASSDKYHPNSITLRPGKSYKITPESHVKQWDSGSPSIATVNSEGVVKAISPGTTYIWATFTKGGMKMYRLNVVQTKESNIYQLDLHEDVRSFSANIASLEFAPWKIRIDMLQDGSYRYASWKNKELSEKPNIVIGNGRYTSTKVNKGVKGEIVEFLFYNYGFEYIITYENVSYGSYDKTTPISLVVKNKGKTIMIVTPDR